MVATNEGGGPGADTGGDSGTALSKLRQTLSSSLMTAQDKVTKSVIRQPEASTPPESSPQDLAAAAAAAAKLAKAEKPVHKAGACRICLRSFKPDDYARICYECHQKVCEDCASYYKQDENQDDTTWRCSICRRKLQSRAQPIIAQESTDSLLDVPVLEGLQRRHSDVKIGSSSLAVSSGPTGLAPPRSPELRRHSDVSPVSLKELEKARERELQWRQHKRDGGTTGQGGSPVGSRATSPSVERRPFVGEERTNLDSQRQRELKAEPVEGEDNGDAESWRRHGSTVANRSRRKSRVQKQHSYDDEIKNTTTVTNHIATGAPDVNLGLIAQLPRRASAYDVFRGEPGRGGGDSSPVVGRRSSFRAVPPPDNDDTTVSSPISPDNTPSLVVEEERRSRRRGSQLPDIAAIRSLPPASRASAVPTRVTDDHTIDTVRRQPSVQDGEAIKIVIHDVDCDPNISSRTGSKRRVALRRDPTDKAHRTRGFGMRVVGGKSGADGRLFAYIVWTVPGGPAEKGGLQQGDKVLEWGGVSLTDRSFEEVCTIMDRTGDTAELVVEHGTDLRMCDLLDEPMPSAARKNSGEAVGLQLTETDTDKSPASPTRRKLPKTPEQLAKERVPVSGRIQLQVFYHEEKNELVVSVFAADDLAPRDDAGFGTTPEAYVQLRLLPFTGDQAAVKTEVSEPSQSPIWNTTLEIHNVSGEQLMDKNVEVTLWDYRPDKEQVFLGECSVDLTKALVDDRPVWYRLEDPRQLRTGKISPRSSLASELTARLLRKDNRSLSEEKDSDAEGGELGGFLHPDHAYVAGSRRGSSQSEQLEVETYQLNKDFSRSLPGSRRSSFQSAGQNAEKEPDIPPPSYKERRRSSCTPRRDPDEILRSLKAVKGELLGRSMSISVDKRGSRRGAGKDGRGRKGSMIVGSEKREPLVSCSSPSDEEDKWSTKSEVKPLGPGQIQPRGYRINPATQAELKLSLLMTKGQLEVEVICARGIQGELPDTYVKTYLRDGERWLQKRKTRAVRHSCEPQFRQTLRYSACDVLGRSLLVMLWEKQKGFEPNIGLGGAELALDAIKLTQLTVGWYPLFPIQTLGSDSNDSP